MTGYYNPDKDKKKVTFKDIVLENYKYASEMFRVEFKEGYSNYISTGNTVNKTYITNKLLEFCQTVEGLALTLIPYFDDEMQTDWEKFLKKKDKDILQATKTLYMNIGFLLRRLNYLESVAQRSIGGKKKKQEPNEEDIESIDIPDNIDEEIPEE